MTTKKSGNSRKGFASNPQHINRKGREAGKPNRVETSRYLKEALKNTAQEALDNIVDVMRFNRDRVEELLEVYSELRARVESTPVPSSKAEKDSLKELIAERDKVFSELKQFQKDTATYSLKLVDYSYNLALHEDKIDVNKKKLAQEKGDKGEDNDDNSVPVFSVVAQ